MIKKKKINKLTAALFAAYLLLLVWIILFKLSFSFRGPDQIRNINLIPFYYATSVDSRIHVKEVLQNVLIFMPFGVYLSMLNHEMRFGAKFLLLCGSSIGLEMAQYLLAVGSTDITDIITNTAGGILGIGVYALLVRFLGGRDRADKVMTALAFAATILVPGGLLFLLLANG